MNRPKISKSKIESGFLDLKAQLERAISKNGDGALISSHEILGVISEEFDEFKVAVKENKIDDQCSELLDIAVAALFGYVCLKDED